MADYKDHMAAGMAEHEKLWHKLRAENVGGSEIAALFNEHPYGMTKFELWHQKKGNIPPHDFSKDEGIMGGIHLESGIAAWASQRWENFQLVKADSYVMHPTIKGMGCTPDYLIAGTEIPVQIKKVNFFAFTKNFAASGEAISDAPLGYLLQLQQEIACLEQQEGWLLVCVGGDYLARMPMKANPTIIKSMEDNVRDFWQSIADDKPPEPNYKMDGEVIARLRKAGRSKEAVDMSDNKGLVELCTLYLEAKEWADGWKKEKAGLNARILEICNGVNVVTCGQHRIFISDIPTIVPTVKKITVEDVGTDITLSKGRAGYPRLTVTDTKAATKDPEPGDE